MEKPSVQNLKTLHHPWNLKNERQETTTGGNTVYRIQVTRIAVLLKLKIDHRKKRKIKAALDHYLGSGLINTDSWFRQLHLTTRKNLEEEETITVMVSTFSAQAAEKCTLSLTNNN